MIDAGTALVFSAVIVVVASLVLFDAVLGYSLKRRIHENLILREDPEALWWFFHSIRTLSVRTLLLAGGALLLASLATVLSLRADSEPPVVVHDDQLAAAVAQNAQAVEDAAVAISAIVARVADPLNRSAIEVRLGDIEAAVLQLSRSGGAPDAGLAQELDQLRAELQALREDMQSQATPSRGQEDALIELLDQRLARIEAAISAARQDGAPVYDAISGLQGTMEAGIEAARTRWSPDREDWSALVEAVDDSGPETISALTRFLQVLLPFAFLGVVIFIYIMWRRAKEAQPPAILVLLGMLGAVTAAGWQVLEPVFNIGDRTVAVYRAFAIAGAEIREARARAEQVEAGWPVQSQFTSIRTGTEPMSPELGRRLFSGAPVESIRFDLNVPRTLQSSLVEPAGLAEFSGRVASLVANCRDQNEPVRLQVFGFSSTEEFAEESASAHARRNAALADRRAALVGARLVESLVRAGFGRAEASKLVTVHQWDSHAEMLRAAPLIDQSGTGATRPAVSDFMRAAFVRFEALGACRPVDPWR
jgi:hypothetical protein